MTRKTLTAGLTTHLCIGRVGVLPGRRGGGIDGGADGNIVVGMRLDMLLQVLRALELLAAELAFVGLEGDVHANVRGDVVALDGLGVAAVPRTDEVEVIGALAADVVLADMLLRRRQAKGPSIRGAGAAGRPT
jgi:hypothetical protein